MTLFLALLGLTVSPGDSCLTLLNLRSIPEAAVLYGQMAAVEDGSWLVNYGRVLEASGRFREAERIYGLALGNSSSSESTLWLRNRIGGTSALDTSMVILVEVENRGSSPALNVQVLLPEPSAHPPFQEMELIQSDFGFSRGILAAEIDTILPGEATVLAMAIRLFQVPGTMRPVTEELSSEVFDFLIQQMRNMPVPDILPGPCVPMAMEMRTLAEREGIQLNVTGGVILDNGECVFHAWNEIQNHGIRLDPLLFKSDSLLAVAHNPSDVIPLWDLGSTDGYELTLLFDGDPESLSGAIRAFLK